MFREVDKMRKDVLGESHEDTLNSNSWCAICLCYKQQFYNAVLTFREVEKMSKEVLGRTLPKLSL